jgi:hypothetical protein
MGPGPVGGQRFGRMRRPGQGNNTGGQDNQGRNRRNNNNNNGGGQGNAGKIITIPKTNQQQQ